MSIPKGVKNVEKVVTSSVESRFLTEMLTRRDPKSARFRKTLKNRENTENSGGGGGP